MHKPMQSVNGKNVDNINVSGVSHQGFFGLIAITGMRTFLGFNNLWYIFALEEHLKRLRLTVAKIFHQKIDDSTFGIWREWVVSAVTCFIRENPSALYPYMHVVYGQIGTDSTVCPGSGSGMALQISIWNKPPQYGSEGIYVSTEHEYCFPFSPISDLKVGGNYCALIELKHRAVERVGTVRRGASVEALLMDHNNPEMVSGFSFSNAGAFVKGVWHFSPAGRVHGITEQIVMQLIREYQLGEIRMDLRREHILAGGFSMSTAGGIEPVIWLDGTSIPSSVRITSLREFYAQLQRGDLPMSNEWTEVIDL